MNEATLDWCPDCAALLTWDALNRGEGCAPCGRTLDQLEGPVATTLTREAWSKRVRSTLEDEGRQVRALQWAVSRRRRTRQPVVIGLRVVAWAAVTFLSALCLLALVFAPPLIIVLAPATLMFAAPLAIGEGLLWGVFPGERLQLFYDQPLETLEADIAGLKERSDQLAKALRTEE